MGQRVDEQEIKIERLLREVTEMRVRMASMPTKADLIWAVFGGCLGVFTYHFLTK